jgi:hypothetical protein
MSSYIFNSGISCTSIGNSNGINKINVNGKTYTLPSGNISITNGIVKVNGKTVDLEDSNLRVSVAQITITGNTGDIECSTADVIVNGESKSITTTTGDVSVGGNVSGDVRATTGSITAYSIHGQCRTTTGDVRRTNNAPNKSMEVSMRMRDAEIIALKKRVESLQAQLKLQSEVMENLLSDKSNPIKESKEALIETNPLPPSVTKESTKTSNKKRKRNSREKDESLLEIPVIDIEGHSDTQTKKPDIDDESHPHPAKEFVSCEDLKEGKEEADVQD